MLVWLNIILVIIFCTLLDNKQMLLKSMPLYCISDGDNTQVTHTQMGNPHYVIFYECSFLPHSSLPLIGFMI